MLKGAIFDLDGTLVDSVPDIANAANVALTSLGLPTFSVPEYMKFAGGGHYRLLTKAITLAQDGVPPTSEQLERAVAIKKSIEDGPNGHDNTTAFPGIHDMLRELDEAGIQIAILSNKQEPTVRAIVRQVFPRVNFRYVAGARDDTPLKPDPSAALRIANDHFHDVLPNECAFVGDTDIDMKTARSGGFHALAVPWGCREKDVLYSSGAALVVDKPSDINKFVLNAKPSLASSF